MRKGHRKLKQIWQKGLVEQLQYQYSSICKTDTLGMNKSQLPANKVSVKNIKIKLELRTETILQKNNAINNIKIHLADPFYCIKQKN